MTSQSTMQFRGHTFDLEASACDFCGSDDFIPFWQKMRHGLNLPTVFCKRCGLCQSRPRPTAAALDLFYSKLYNEFHSRETPIDPKGEYVARSARTAAPRVEVLKKFLDPTKPLKVVEIGTGVGQFQRIAREKTQWALEGIEPGEAQAAFCVSQGANVRNVFFTDAAGLQEEAYDAVVSFHVFEHVKEPSDFIARASRLVKPGGLLYVEVPNLARPGSHFDDFLQFPHLYNFSSNTLRNYVSVIGGLRPIFTAERTANLGLIARKGESTPPRTGKPDAGDYETYDVENFVQRLRMLERVMKLADGIPNVSVLGKVRGTLMSI